MRRRDPGFTLFEAVAVMAVVAVLALLLVPSWTRAHLAHEARRTAADVLVRRAEAVVGGRVVDVLGTCSTVESTGLRSPLISRWPRRGLVFTRDGLPRTCDGGGVGNATILLEHRGRQAAVIVSSLGRVRWELR